MTALEAVRAKLVADAALVALVGQRIYPGVAPQDAPRPYMVLTLISEVPQNALSESPATRLLEARMQVDSYALTYLQAHAVAKAADDVVAALATKELSAVRLSLADDWNDTPELHRVSAEYSVWR